MSCRTVTDTVSRMEKAGPFDCCCLTTAISQWRCRLSACVRAHGVHSEHILWVFMAPCVKLMLRIFEFGVLLFVYCLTVLFFAKM